VNPFDLPGPQFLLLYALVGALVLGTLAAVRILRESGPGRVRLTDPYLIGCLRGGVPEALRLVVVSLVDRDLLERTGTTLASRPGAAARVLHPLERAVLERFERGGEAAAIFSDPGLAAAAGPLRETLERHGLLPSAAVRLERWGRLLLALAVLVGFAGIKVAVALARGRTNVLFLVVLTVLFCGLAFVLGLRTRTVRGEMALADLRRLFERQRARAAHLQAEERDEALLIAAVFGLAVLPAPWAYAQRVFPRAAKQGGGSGSSCGSASSSCGSASSCGSSCGGGGCGGGCGGCGS
jgi:uncharacterized protein (TIGR04222 family)